MDDAVGGLNIGDFYSRLIYLHTVRQVDCDRLSAEGLSLEGIRRVLELQAEIEFLRARLEEFTAQARSRALEVWQPQRRTRTPQARK